MTAVLLLPPFLQFFDSNGDPLAGGFVYTYAAGTTTPKATYTNAAGTIEAPNPIQLDAAGIPTSGNGGIWGSGSYKIIVKNAAGVQIETPQDNITTFTTLAAANNAYFESFSGTGSQTTFTTSQDLGTEEKGLMIFINSGLQALVVNGTFATDTIWTKGAGWTIAAGVATATGAISTAISQTAAFPIVAGQAYSVTYTITRSAGGLIPSIGGTAGTERTASGTYNEVIIAGSTQTIAFTGNAFTGTLDNVSVNLVAPSTYAIQNPNAYTISGTSLTFASAPPVGTNNIYVFAPSLLLGAASAAAEAAIAAAAAALTSQTSANASAVSAAAYAQAKVRWTFSSTTTMAAPGSSNIRLNNATIASATAIAISDLSADSGTPDLSAWINTWDDGSGSNRGTIYIFKDNANFALFAVNSANVDNTTWNQISVTYLAGQGTFTNLDTLFLGFAASGTTTVTGGITALTGDVTASGSGSIAATIANLAVTNAKIANTTIDLTAKVTGTLPVANGGTGAATLTANNVILGNGTSAVAFVAPSTSGNVLTSNGTTWSSAASTSSLPTAATTATTSGASVVLTVNFTTNFSTRIHMNGVSNNTGSADYTLEASSNAGVGYATTTYQTKSMATTTNANNTAKFAETVNASDLLNGTIDIWQDSTSGATRFTCLISNAGGAVVSWGGGSMDTSAATNRIRIAVVGGPSFDAGSVSVIATALR